MASSLKTELNCGVVSEIPLERLLLETDSPWCGIRPSHFSAKYVHTKFPTAKKKWTSGEMFKARNEPQTILYDQLLFGLIGRNDY
jgi:TatD DNase family protein